MRSIFITYGTGQGQTAEVARYIQSILEEHDHDVVLRHVSNTADVAIEDFDGVLVGASVNSGRHQPAVVEYVERHREALANRPSGFFQLSLASAYSNRWAQEGAKDWAESLFEETGWQPDRLGLFAGAVTYTQYGRFERLLFKLVSAVTTGDTDTSRDYEYTDWDEVETFAVDFGEYVDARREEAGAVGPRIAPRRAAVLAMFGAGVLGTAYWLSQRRESSPPEATKDGDASADRTGSTDASDTVGKRAGDGAADTVDTLGDSAESA